MGFCRDPLVGQHAGCERMQLGRNSPGGCQLEQVTVGVQGVLSQVVQGVFGRQAVGRRAMQLPPCHSSSAAVAPKAGGRDRPEVSFCIHHPSSLSPGAAFGTDCQEKETPRAPEQAERGWDTHPAGLPRAEGHQDSKRSKRLLGQLTHTPRGQGDTPSRVRWATHAQS